jgi:hypothetical protein
VDSAEREEMTRPSKLDTLRTDYGRLCDLAMAEPSSRRLADREWAYARLVEFELAETESRVRARRAS